MISTIHQLLRHVPKRQAILAVITDRRIHNGSGNDDYQEDLYEKRLKPHDAAWYAISFYKSRAK